jgi:hypothetical protein
MTVKRGCGGAAEDGRMLGTTLGRPRKRTSAACPLFPHDLAVPGRDEGLRREGRSLSSGGVAHKVFAI